MSKPLSSFKDNELQRAVARRINSATGGLGYLSAKDYQAGKATRVKAAQKKAREAEMVIEEVPTVLTEEDVNYLILGVVLEGLRTVAE